MSRQLTIQNLISHQETLHFKENWLPTRYKKIRHNINFIIANY